MKKLLVLVISAVLLLSAFAFPAAADEPVWTEFWLTHYNDSSAEGAGVVFTTSYSGGGWWNHVAFAPVEGLENVYEVVDYCAGDGNAVPLDIPEGGFVWATNVGNNWPALFEQYGATGDGASGQWFDDATHAAYPNYVTNGSQNAWTVSGMMLIGDKYIFEGIDFEGLTVPTDTPDKMWYDEGYVCTAKFALYVEEAAGGDDEPESEAEVSENVTESEADTSVETNESVADTSVEADVSEEVPAEEDGLSTGALIAIIAAVVVVIAAVVVIVAKKKK